MYDARDAPLDGVIPAWRWNVFARETAEAVQPLYRDPGQHGEAGSQGGDHSGKEGRT